MDSGLDLKLKDSFSKGFGAHHGNACPGSHFVSRSHPECYSCLVSPHAKFQDIPRLIDPSNEDLSSRGAK